MKNFITARRPRRIPVTRRRLPSVERLDERTLLSGFAPDPSFGQGGFVATLNGQTGTHSVALAPNGKILELAIISGRSSVLRFNADGTPDNTFGDHGVSPSPIEAQAITVQGDGAVVIGGPGPEGASFAASRLLPNGALDTGYGTGGTTDVLASNIHGSSVTALAVDGQGRIILIGQKTETGMGPLLVATRIDTHGQLDTTFGYGGGYYSGLGDNHLFPYLEWDDLAIQPDGKILIAGNRSAIRLGTDGLPDPTFTGDANGFIGPANFSTATSVLLQPDGKILLLFPSFGLARLNPDGTTDTSFGVGGKARWLSPIVPTDFVLQPNGRIIVAGYTPGDSPQGMLVRFLADGRPDPTHHDVVTAQTTGALIAEPDGSLIVGGTVTPAGSNDRYGVIVKELVGPEASPDVQYVSQLYADLLNRLPDDAGLQSYVMELQHGVSRGQVAEQLLNSDEYLTIQINAQYQVVLGRMSDPTGLQHWLNLLHSGGTLIEVEAGLFGSPEYPGGTNDQFLDGLYHKVLGRDIDPVGQASYSQALASGTSRGDVAQSLLRSTESATNRVQAYYHAFLRRGADPDGLAHWVNVFLASGGDDEPVADGLLATDEYLAILRYPAPL